MLPVSWSVPVLFLVRPPLLMTALMTRSFGFVGATFGFSATRPPGCTSMVRVAPPRDRLPLMVAGVWLARLTRSAMLPPRVSVPVPVVTLPPTRRQGVGQADADGVREAVQVEQARIVDGDAGRSGESGCSPSRRTTSALLASGAADEVADGQGAGDGHAAGVVEQQHAGVDRRRAGVGVGHACR